MTKLTKYVIYLTGKESESYLLFQKYFESKNKLFKKPTLGMHCTILRFHSVVDENILIEEFNKLYLSLSPILVTIQKADLFAEDSVVLRLDKTFPIEKLHRDSIRIFNPYEIITSEVRYVGINYAPHITTCHVPNISSIPNKISRVVCNKEVILDTLVFIKAESDWKILIEKKLV